MVFFFLGWFFLPFASSLVQFSRKRSASVHTLLFFLVLLPNDVVVCLNCVFLSPCVSGNRVHFQTRNNNFKENFFSLSSAVVVELLASLVFTSRNNREHRESQRGEGKKNRPQMNRRRMSVVSAPSNNVENEKNDSFFSLSLSLCSNNSSLMQKSYGDRVSQLLECQRRRRRRRKNCSGL